MGVNNGEQKASCRSLQCRRFLRVRENEKHPQMIHCKTVGFFFLKISKEIGKAWRKSPTRAKRS